jgi:hypothetical protein
MTNDKAAPAAPAWTDADIRHAYIKEYGYEPTKGDFAAFKCAFRAGLAAAAPAKEPYRHIMSLQECADAESPQHPPQDAPAKEPKAGDPACFGFGTYIDKPAPAPDAAPDVAAMVARLRMARAKTGSKLYGEAASRIEALARERDWLRKRHVSQGDA